MLSRPVSLSAAQRRELRAQAHALNPVVIISQNGLTDAVLKEIDVSLKAHELIKIRVVGDSREARDAYLASICEQLQAAPVQQIGKLLVVYRPKPLEAETKAAAPAKPGRPAPKTPRRNKQSFQGHGSR